MPTSSLAHHHPLAWAAYPSLVTAVIAIPFIPSATLAVVSAMVAFAVAFALLASSNPQLVNTRVTL